MSGLLNLQSRGPEVVEAQDLLNRSGMLLEADGKFGKVTEAAVREFQASKGLPATGSVDDATWTELRLVPEPSPVIPSRAVTFICKEEVSSRSFYETQCSRPTRPGFDSGVTIGVGYDLGYQQDFDSTWGAVLTPTAMAALRPWLGKKGQEAEPAVALLSHIVIPWQMAWTVFISKTLPQEIRETRNAFVWSGKMSALSFGALVSLVYNRGAQMTDPASQPGRRREMREIRAALAAGNIEAVPVALRSMKRLWPGTALAERREREAQMFEAGMVLAKGAGQ